VKETKKGGFNQHYDMFRTIENGVKETLTDFSNDGPLVDDVIENGIKETLWSNANNPHPIIDAIQNGIKETKSPGADGDILPTLEWMKENNTVNIPELINDVIENGVKYTEAGWAQYNSVDDVIERGIKRTEGGMLFDETKVDRIISEGVKLTNSSLQIDGSCVVEDVIQNGIKETKLGAPDNRDYFINDAIQNGIKETHDDVYHHKGRVGGVIKNGVKQCIPSHTPLYNPMDFSVVYRENHRLDDVASVLEKGIKEVQPLPSQEGNMDWGNYYHRQEDRTKPHTKYVDDVITNGIKKTKAMDEWVNTDRILDFVISNGTSI